MIYGLQKWTDPGNYKNALLFNQHSPRMNKTLHGLLQKLCLKKNMIKTSCFLYLNSECIDVEE